MKWIRKLLRQSVERLIGLACVFALVGLAIMAYSILVPRPLPVIFAMSVGHGVGALAVLFYGLAVVIDAMRRDRAAEPAAPIETPKS